MCFVDFIKNLAWTVIWFVIFTSTISECSQGVESVQLGNLRIISELFASHVVLLASLDPDCKCP